MAMNATITTGIKIVDGGVTVVDREFTYAYEVTGKVEGDYWLDTSTSSVTLCVKGTNISTPAIVDPMVVGLTTIRGIAIKNELNIEIAINGAAVGIPVAEGNFEIGQAEIQTVQITKDDTRSGLIHFIVWGDR